jgi:RNA polymerase sigma-70 factor (ECF subfamily)
MMAIAIGETGLGCMAAEDARDEPEITALVANFSGMLYRVALSVLRNPAEAEDVVQETFVRVLEGRTRLAGVRELRPWLARIAWNLALDRRRRTAPEQMEEAVAASLVSRECPADEAVAEARNLARVLAAVDRLPRTEREVLLLCAVEELSTTEVAVVLKRSESSVRSLMFRARAHLRERLEGTEQGARSKRGGRR